MNIPLSLADCYRNFMNLRTKDKYKFLNLTEFSEIIEKNILNWKYHLPITRGKMAYTLKRRLEGATLEDIGKEIGASRATVALFECRSLRIVWVHKVEKRNGSK